MSFGLTTALGSSHSLRVQVSFLLASALSAPEKTHINTSWNSTVPAQGQGKRVLVLSF